MQDPKVQTMLDDLMATDEKVEPAPMSVEDESGIDGRFDGPEISIPSGLQPLDLRHLNAGDWSMIVATLMARLGVEDLTLADLERQTVAAPNNEGKVRVLVASFNPADADLHLSLQLTKPSEFRS